MIQFTKDFCKKDICNLWHVTFGDDFEYIEYVYGVFKKHGRFYGLFDGKTLVSMMLVLDLPLNFYGQVQKSAYMYACATNKNYKGKGLFSSLYKQAKEALIKDGYENIYCVPQSDSLFGMYSKLGLDKYLYRSKIEVKFDGRLPEILFEQTDDYDRAYSLYCQRSRKSDGFCQKSRELFECAIKSADTKIYFFDGGYFCYDGHEINELIVLDDSVKDTVLRDMARFLKKDLTCVLQPCTKNMKRYVALEKLKKGQFFDGTFANMLFD